MTETRVRSTINVQRFRWLLVVWTLGIWGSRVRNILADDELSGLDSLVSLLVALVMISLALGVVWTLARRERRQSAVLAGLVGVGILRWTVRGPVILWSDDWEVGFKVVHTVLWLATVALSLLAWREHGNE